MTARSVTGGDPGINRTGPVVPTATGGELTGATRGGLLNDGPRGGTHDEGAAGGDVRGMIYTDTEIPRWN